MKTNYALTLYLMISCVFSPSLSANAKEFKSPDQKVTYICGAEKNSAMGCFTHWVKSIRPDLESDVYVDTGKWRPAACSSTREEGGLCYQGGVAWWYWSKGKIGDAELQDFVHRDYAGPKNETNLGNAFLAINGGYCYTARRRTFCMIPMSQ